MTPQPFHSRDFAYTADGDAIEPPLSSPPLSSPGTSARFEFEIGRGNNGTKILLVEWPATTASQTTVYWESMPSGGVLSADDSRSSSLNERRMFLLPAYSSVPRTVYITNEQENLQTNPLPAIYPPRSNDSGRKGVLHTIFARARLRDLEAEIQSEACTNTESVALEMALQEKSWIEQEYFLSDGSFHHGKKEKSKSKRTSSRSPAKSSSKEGKNGPVVKCEKTYEETYEEESGDDLFAVNLSPRKPEDMLSPYSMRTREYVPWR